MTSADHDFTIRFWGVRGSTPTAEWNKRQAGGNTPCLELRYGNEPPVILDAGTGIRLLGAHLRASLKEEVRAEILFSHFHWDHIQGLPFFEPLYSRSSRFVLHSTLAPALLEQILRDQMKDPYFPIPYSSIRAGLSYGQVDEAGIKIGSLTFQPIRLNHPGGCSGYRIESPVGAVVYVSDHEHGVPSIDSAVERFAAGARVLIYDAHFTPEEYPQYKGWGHSTWLEGTRLAMQAQVSQLFLFHHSPFRKDEAVDALLSQAKLHFPATEAARENSEIVLTKLSKK